MDNIYSALNCNDNDYSAVFALCLIYALLDNKGNSRSLQFLIYRFKSIKYTYFLVDLDKLLKTIKVLEIYVLNVVFFATVFYLSSLN